MAPTIYPDSRGDAPALARTLLDAAGPDGHGQVQTSTDGPAGIAFVISDELYEKVIGTSDAPGPPHAPSPDRGATAPPDDEQAPDDGVPDPIESTVTEPSGDREHAGGDTDEGDSTGAGAADTTPAPVRARRRPR